MQGRLHASPSMASSKEYAQAPRQAWRPPSPPPGRTRVPDEAGPQVDLLGKRSPKWQWLAFLSVVGHACWMSCTGECPELLGDVEVVL